MSRINNNFINEKSAQKSKTESLNTTLRLFKLLGKPFYLILLAVLYLLYITGYFSRTILTNLFSYLVSLFSVIFLSLPRQVVKSTLRSIYKKISLKTQREILIKTYQIKTSFKDLFSPTKLIRPKKIKVIEISQGLKKLVKSSGNKVSSLANILLKILRSSIHKPKELLVTGKKPKEKKSIFSLKKIGSKLFRVTLALFILSAIFFGYVFWLVILKDLPSPNQLTERKVEVSTKIYDRNNILLYQIYKEENRTIIPLEKIPLYARLATLAIEDAEFYSHPGFSIRGILRAVVKNIKKGELTGGSTITQQLVKNALLTPEKTIVRKIKEVILSVQVELKYDKNQILEMYLNEVSYGGTAYGIQEAAKQYFGKNVENLTISESALLAGLPKSPSRFSPFGSNPNFSILRRNEVLNLMRVNGYITKDQYQEAVNEEVSFAKNITEIKAPHFVMYTREKLEEEYGSSLIETGGLNVYTTLDLRVQNLSEQIVKDEIEKLEKLNVTNAAVLVIDAKTGEILSMVGSRDYFDIAAEGNVNVALSPRQPGSSIKIINYAYALSHGYTPATLLKDTPVTFKIEGQEDYTPKNYEGSYRGILPLRNALAESRNIPAVRVLASYGVDKMIEMGRKMGITTWENPKNYGLSLTLGGGEVKLIDLSQAYLVLANYGKKVPITSISKVLNFKGSVIYEDECIQKKAGFASEFSNLTKYAQASSSVLGLKSPITDPCERGQVLDERVAFLLTDILKDNEARAPSFGRNSMLVIPNHPEVAVKTGTSNNLRDNLTIGYNQDYLVAVWVGNNDNSPMSSIASGVTGASPIFNKIMSALLSDKQSVEWAVPAKITQLPICSLTETLACSNCPIKMEWFLEETKPQKACSPEVVKQIRERQIRSSSGQGDILDSSAQTQVVE